MKRFFLYTVLLLMVGEIFSSCLKKDLDALPAFSDVNIDRFDFEYRWNDNGTFRVVTFNTDVPAVSDKVLKVTTTVPDASGTFTDAIRNQVSLANIVAKCNISTAATIKPVGDSPKLGVPADFSKEAIYEVTAADGVTKKQWTLVLTLVK